MTFKFHSYAIKNLAAGSSINAGFPKSFSGQMGLLINSDYPLTMIVFIFSMAIVIFFSGYRKFFIFWAAIIIALLLNPIVSDFVMKNITTENIYWRLFYLLPFPLVPLVAFSILIKSNWVSRAFALLLFTLLVPAAIWGPTSILRHENRQPFDNIGYKIASKDLSISKNILDKIPYGSMFAPLAISNIILLLSSHYPQFYVTETYLKLILNSVGHSQEFNERVNAYAYLYKEDLSDSRKISFVNIINSEKRPIHVIAPIKSINRKDLIDILVQAGYKSDFSIDDQYEIFSHTKTEW